MSHKFQFLTFLLAVLLFSDLAQINAFAQCEPKAPTPIFRDDSNPLPPNQNAAWQPQATSLPVQFVTATQTLFEQGLADPRGLEYRQIDVVFGSVWGGAGVCKMHGWVLPKVTPDQTQRFGVGWNGLVYPLVSIGEPANVNDDILKAVKADEDMRARYKTERPDFPFYRFRPALPDSSSMSERVLLPLKACLLLRLGETKLAEKVWTTWTAGMNPSVNDDAVHLRDPYLMLITEWTWALFDRAVTAHMRGDDRFCLLSASALTVIASSVEREIDHRDLITSGRASAVRGGRTRYLSFLEPLPELLADAERRLKEDSSSRRKTLQDDLQIRDTRARVEALVRRLDEVVAMQDGQPGGVDLARNEIVTALIAQGPEAVEPLINVVDNDTRLTRSVSFGRDFSYDRHLIGVHEAAYAALVEILKTANFGSGSHWDNWEKLRKGRLEERHAIAAEIRKYIKEYGRLSLEDRWYRVLNDNDARDDQWLEAAAFIVQRSDYNALPPAWAFTDSRMPKPGETFHLRGEPLRRKINPTLSELLVRRMKDLAQRATGPNWSLPMEKAVSLALALGTWDGAAHIEELQHLMSTLVDQYVNSSSSNVSKRPQLIGMIVQLTLKRCELGDGPALKDYAAWLRMVEPADTEYSTILLFEPALKYSTAPEVEGAVSWMFLDPKSPWVPLVPRKPVYNNVDTARLIEKLMDFRAFREQLLKCLEDESVVGTLFPRLTSQNTEYDLKVDNNVAAVAAGSSNVATVLRISRMDSQAPRPPLEPVTFRVSDVYAWKLRGYEGAPRIELYWTEAQRDAAIAACKEFLRQHTGKFVYSPERAYKYTQ